MTTTMTKNAFLLQNIATLESVLSETQKRDKLFIRFDREASSHVSCAYRADVSVYSVTNLTTNHVYQVRFYVRADKRLAECNCRAQKICKHIVRAIALHVARKQAQKLASVEFESIVESVRETQSEREMSAFCDICSARETDTRDNLEIAGWFLGMREQFCPTCNQD